MTTGQENLFHWSYVHKNTSTFWHFRLCRYNLYCSWDPLSLEAKLRKRRERKRERRKETFTGYADLEVGTILFCSLSFFPSPPSLFLLWRKLRSWELAVWFLLRLPTTLLPIFHYVMWLNFKRGGWKKRGHFVKRIKLWYSVPVNTCRRENSVWFVHLSSSPSDPELFCRRIHPQI